MTAEFSWDDAEDIGILLQEKFPELDPLAVRFTDLHRYVTELPGFTGDPKASNEGKLEAIQMAWYEEYKEYKDNQ
ncbi:MAG TPA: Fe-S cluster assembly protein IscX [Candidatus Angelobacter sp.]